MRASLFFLAMPLVLTGSVVTSIAVGAAGLRVYDVVRALASRILGLGSDGLHEYIVWDLRLPRALGAAVVGAALASAGAVVQTSLRNPIASPYTIGLSSAAALGASIAIILGAGFISQYPYVPVITNPWVVVLNAFVMCMITTAIIGAVARVRGSDPVTVILVGIAISYLYSAAVSILQYLSQVEALKSVIIWLLGDMSRMSWDYLRLCSLSLLFIPAAAMLGWRLNALTFGEEVAQSLGVNVRRLRAVSAVISGLMVALTIPFVGTIGFVCLISPHVARLIVGSNVVQLVPASALVGATLLVLSDTAARTIVAPLELPVGAITACMGGPFLVYLLMRARRAMWL